MDIEAAIAEAFPAPAAAQPRADATPKAETDATAQPAEGNQETKSEGETEKPKEAEGEAKEETPFPKKAVNTIARLKGDKYKQAQEIKSLRQRLAALESVKPTPAPKEEDFEGKTVAEFAKESAKHAATEAINQEKTKDAQEQLAAKEKEYVAAVQEHVNNSAEKAAELLPDFHKVIEQASTMRRQDGSSYLPLSDEARSAFEESDNPALALYAIIKDGALAELNGLSLAKAAMMVRDYEVKGEALTKVKKVSTAPEPIGAAKGTGSGGKSLDRMSYEDLRTEFKLY